MKGIVAALLCLFLAVPVEADEGGKKNPKPQKPQKLFDGKLILAGITMLAAEIADNETTMAVMRRNSHAHEANPFYGAHPSRLRIYSIGTALTGLMFLTSVAARQQALRQNKKNSKLWLVPIMAHDAGRALAAWHNAGIPASHPHLLTVCPAGGAGCR